MYSHKYIKNTSSCGTIFVEYLLYWQKISQKQTSREATLQLGRTKLFKKGIKIGPTPSGGSYKEEDSLWGYLLGQKGRFRGSKKKKKKKVKYTCGRQNKEKLVQMVLVTLLHSTT